jgi:hypothetical protein
MQHRKLVLLAGLAALCAQAQTPSPAPQTPGWEAGLKAVASACKGDTPKVCPNLSTETAVACLQANIEKLSPACKDAVTNLAKSAVGF